jgi:pimeloyl-ACP methyl ester carboxylesterase
VSIPPMSTFVLVHGAWHGAWCWYKIIPLLEEAGQKVVALDLPSLGMDRTSIAAVIPDMWCPTASVPVASMDSQQARWLVLPRA